MISENFLEPNDGKALPWKDVRKASWSLVHVRPPTERRRLRQDLEKRRQPTSLAGKAFAGTFAPGVCFGAGLHH